MKFPLPLIAALGLLSLTVALIACSSGGSAADPPDSSASVSWTTVYGQVITSQQCTDHHSGGASAAGSLDLGTKSTAFTNLVGVAAAGPSCGPAGIDGGTPELRVRPGDSAASLLYQKLVATPGLCGAPMPDLGTELPASQIALVKSWIDEGAPND